MLCGFSTANFKNDLNLFEIWFSKNSNFRNFAIKIIKNYTENIEFGQNKYEIFMKLSNSSFDAWNFFFRFVS
jgi:hypothetical protein